MMQDELKNSDERPKLCVVGSSNYDLISYAKRLPKLGETIHGTHFQMGFGGKGANQAVTAAKLGADVTMITKLGEDIFGKQTLENYQHHGIITEYVYFTDQAFSGVAPIIVDESGHNLIIVVAGANNLLTHAEIEQASSAIAQAKILICQLEIPVAMTQKAMEIAKAAGVMTILNPAPAPEDGLPDALYQLTDILCPNETEAEYLTGVKINSLEDAQQAAKILFGRGVQTVLMTLGENGSLLISKDKMEHVSSIPVMAKDSTGAGDCFIGSFAFFYAKGMPILEAIQKANEVAAISVQKNGTQTSFPSVSELPADFL